jgi:hypothetical protein
LAADFIEMGDRISNDSFSASCLDEICTLILGYAEISIPASDGATHQTSEPLTISII